MTLSRRSFVIALTSCAAASAFSALAMPGCEKAPASGPVITATPAVVNPADVDAAELEKQARKVLAGLTAEQKVAQLFIITPEALTGYDQVTAAGRVSKEAYRDTPVGGLIYFAKNLESLEQVTGMLANMQTYARDTVGLPLFLCIDEEGGDVVRVAGNPAFGVANPGDACDIGATGDVTVAQSAASGIGEYLGRLGFNVNFAPVADVVSNPEGSAMRWRSFGSDPELVADMVCAQVKAYLERGIVPCAKHFPGIGNAAGDSHDGAITISADRAELDACELVPFKAAIEAGVPMVMVGHVGVPKLTGSDIPASASSILMARVLREDLGFTGLVVTDALNMGAVYNLYADWRIGVEVLLAGADLILMPPDYQAAFDGIMAALKSGELTQERIDESLMRVIMLKLSMS